ncbi:hypothetical protein Tco_0446044 [Tanacetum coccineum]
MDVERSHSNPIYKIAVDILKQTNFFGSFIASSTIPSIYIQQFWDTVRYDKTTGNYNCQLDEQWFDLTKDTLRDILQITPVDNNNAFTSPPTPDALIKFVNDLGYPKVVITLSDVVTNDMFQPWRAPTTIINLCLTEKTSGFERPRAPMFSKLIIYRLQSKHKFHPRLGSTLHFPNKASVLGYLKFSAKGTKREVFGMPIPNDLINDDIRGEQYYNAYLEKVAKHQRYLAGEEVSDPDSPAPKLAKATKHKATKKSKPSVPKAATVTKPTVAKASKSQQPKSAPVKPQEKKRKLLIDEFADEGVPENEPRLDDEEAETRTSIPTKSSGYDESSSLYAELGLTVSETESDEEVPGIVARVQDEGQAGPNPGEHDEGQAGPNPGDAAASQPPSSHVVHAGPNLEHMDLEASDTSIQPNPEQMDEEFTTTAYPNVQENLKLPTEGEVRLEEPASSAGTLSSLQNLDKELSFTNQFLAEKSQEDEPEKTNIEAEVQSMVTVPIHQDTSSVPLMTTPDIDLTVSQPVPLTVR